MNVNRFKWILPALAAALLVGCTGTSTTTNVPPPAQEGGKEGEAPPQGKALKVGIVFDSGGRGDKSFNDSAWAGIERAQKEFGIEAVDIQSNSAAQYESNLTKLADRKLDIIFAVGLGQQQALAKVAPKFPDTKFAVVDGNVDAPNVRSLQFREEQGSFLAGYLAGLMTKSGKIGFVGGMEIPLIRKFQYGYFAGAKMANPKVVTLPAKFTGDWNNADKGKAAAALLYGEGADIVYHAAGRAGLGVFTAAKEANAFAIGVDSNQDYIEKGRILTSMVKRVDEAVYATIKDLMDGKFSAGAKVYDISTKGVGLTEFEFTKDAIGEANIAKIAEIEQKIANGDIQVPADEEAYNKFIAALPK